MFSKIKKPILVTGSHRSGTTWAGRVIATHSDVCYIHEPFHFNHRPGICAAQFKCAFPYITAENEHLYYRPICRTIDLSYDFAAEIRALRSLKDAARLVRDALHFLRGRAVGARTLLKDPMALFSAEWLANHFTMDIIVLIRHPAAFASSLKLKNWQFDFRHLLQQPLLMRDHLGTFEEDMEKCVVHNCDIIDQAAVLWRMIYSVVARYKIHHPDWIFIRHEDLSRDPHGGFRQLLNHVGLDLPDNVLREIDRTSRPDNPVNGMNDLDIRRDSLSVVWNWKKRLTPSEIERINDQVSDVSQMFYSDHDW